MGPGNPACQRCRGRVCGGSSVANGSAEVKELLMEVGRGKASGAEILLELLPELHWSAEPDIGGLPLRHAAHDVLRGEPSALRGHPHVEANVRVGRETPETLVHAHAGRGRR